MKADKLLEEILMILHAVKEDSKELKKILDFDPLDISLQSLSFERVDKVNK